MKTISIIPYLLLFVLSNIYSQPALPVEGGEFPEAGPLLTLRQVLDANPSAADSILLTAIGKADQTASLGQLAGLARLAGAHCAKSKQVSAALLGWMRENHAIYLDKSPTEANQFRGFLLYMLGHFPPGPELLKYVKSELLFGQHAFNIAAAAYAARIFPSQAPELIPLLNPYLQPSFRDEAVDITDFELHYPPLNATKARYEVIKTLSVYGSLANSSVPLISALVREEKQNAHGGDAYLIDICEQAIREINKSVPSCCQKAADACTARQENPHAGSGAQSLASVETMNTIAAPRVFSKKERKKVTAKQLAMLDQNGDGVKFRNLKGKPFVLSFFYTSCTNPLKCASTVYRMGELQKLAAGNGLEDEIGIYGMTYDAGFDSPSIIKAYGQSYGVSFSGNAKFLVPEHDSERELFEQLDIRVNYGGGSVNHHGVQLFVFDKRGKIAAIYDNYAWEAQHVLDNLMVLAAE